MYGNCAVLVACYEAQVAARCVCACLMQALIDVQARLCDVSEFILHVAGRGGRGGRQCAARASGECAGPGHMARSPSSAANSPWSLDIGGSQRERLCSELESVRELLVMRERQIDTLRSIQKQERATAGDERCAARTALL